MIVFIMIPKADLKLNLLTILKVHQQQVYLRKAEERIVLLTNLLIKLSRKSSRLIFKRG